MNWQSQSEELQGGNWNTMKGQQMGTMNWQGGDGQWNPNQGQAQYQNWMPAYYPPVVTNWTQGSTGESQNRWDLGEGVKG